MVKVKVTTKHGQHYMKHESLARRRMWKAYRRKALRHNDRVAIKELNQP